MKSKVIVLILTIFAMTGSALAGYFTYPAKHPVEPSHFDIRSKAVISQAHQRHFAQIFLGDSVVELALINKICGVETLDAGIGSTRVEDVANFSKRLPYIPESILISVGLNDAAKPTLTSPDAYARTYEAMVSELKARGAIHLSLALIQPVSDTKALGSNYFDTRLIAEYNKKIVVIAHKFGATVIYFDRLSTNATGGLRDELTVDGVHLSETGYDSWFGQLADSCPRS